MESTEAGNLLFVLPGLTLTGRFSIDTAAPRLPPSPSFSAARFRAVTALSFALGDFSGTRTNPDIVLFSDVGHKSVLLVTGQQANGLVAPDYAAVVFAGFGISLAFTTGALGPSTDVLPDVLPLDQLLFTEGSTGWPGDPGPFVSFSITEIARVPTPVPEPAVLALLGAGLLGMVAARLSRRRPAPPA